MTQPHEQKRARLNSVLQKLRMKLVKGVLDEGETPDTSMTRERIDEIVVAIAAENNMVVDDETINKAFDEVAAKQQQLLARQPRNLAEEYRAAMTDPPKPSQGVMGEALAACLRFFKTRDDVRALLGIDDNNAGEWVVAWADAGDNGRKLAAYLDVAGRALEEASVGLFTRVILYGHIGYGPLPGQQAGTDPGDPRLGQTKLYRPKDVAKFLHDKPVSLAVIGCDSDKFARELADIYPVEIVYTTRPYQWRKAGKQSLEYLLAQDSSTQEVYGTLIDILER